MTEEPLRQWLASCQCAQYHPNFVERGVTADLVPELDSAALRELGVAVVGDRLRMELAIARLKADAAAATLVSNDELRRLVRLHCGDDDAADTPGTSTSTLVGPPTDGDAVDLTDKNVTFLLQDGSSKRVNITGCFNAQSIKRKVLRKLGIKPNSSLDLAYDAYVDADDGAAMLYDVELVTICYSPDRHEKHRIMLCPRHHPPTAAQLEASRRIAQRHKLGRRARDAPPASKMSQYHIPATRGAAAGAAAGAAGGAAAPPTLRNFFGQRPPSELISSNLAEYFPEAKQRELEQTVRNSVRYSVQYSRRLPVSSASSQRRASVASTRASLASDPKRAPASRTIGEMMVSNIAAIDEAAATLKPPPSDASIASSRASRRVSVNFGDAHHRHSRIELLSVDSDDDDDVVGGYLDDSALDAILETEVSPNWLQGARIGAGSFGTVYLGMSPLTGELMAVKQVSLPDAANHSSSQIEALQHEMSLLKQLNHENIVRYLGSATNSHYLNIFLEYVPGGSVSSMLSSYGPFEEPLIRNFVRQVLIGLSYLHGEDIIHRDIKGANILIDIKGTVKISDFGISKKLSRYESAEGHAAPAAPPAGGDEDRTSRRASLQGSVYWMAPEVVKQTAYTKKADIWSVGCLIVEMFTGKHPFPDFSQMQAIFKIGTHVAPQIPEWCTREAQDFLRRSFELDYRNRPDAVDMLAEPFLNTLIMSKGT